MTGLVIALVSCILGTGQAVDCMPIIDQIVEEEKRIEKEECEKNNCYGFTIGISGFPYDSDANRVANYRYWESSGNIDMIATFMQEGMFNKDAISKTKDYGICQLHYNKTNAKWIDDPRWSDIMYQAEVCLDKRNAVKDPKKTRYGRSNREKHKKKIYYFN